MASRFYFLESQLMILTNGDDKSSISTCPLSFDQHSLKINDEHSSKRNDEANFNCICRLPPPVWLCPNSVLGFKYLQERVGYLQRLFSWKIFGISKSFQAQNHFDICLNKFVLKRIQVISLSGFMLFLTGMWTNIYFMTHTSKRLWSSHVKHL